MHRILVFAGLVVVAAPLAAATPSLELRSPLHRSFEAADLAKTPPGAVPLRVGSLPVLWSATSIRLTDMPMPDGSDATLLLERRPNPVEATWLVRTDADGRETRQHVAAAPVMLLAGMVEGQPGSAVFLGLADGQAQGWIETSEGLHLISTPPDGGPTLLFRVGAERGGVDIPGPGMMQRTELFDLAVGASRGGPPEFVPVTEYDQMLLEMQNPESPLRSLLLGEGGRRLPEFIDRAIGSAAVGDPVLGACCVMPGFCFQMEAEACADFCDSPDDFCDNIVGSDPAQPYDADNPPQCWLGEGVRCDERWACFESFDDPTDPTHPGNGNWFGACCIEDPSTPGLFDIIDLSACECAFKGGRFVIEPAICLGDELASPGEMPASNFVDAATILGIDPFFCSSPPGACCIEQQILCEDFSDDPEDPILEHFEQVACINVPESICNDASIIEGSFNGTGQPGFYTKDCFPCVFDASLGGSPQQSGTDWQDFICPASMQDELNGGVHAPPQAECQYARLTVDTDGWYLDRFDGNVQAGQLYATLLMASVNWILERDALVSFQIGDLILRGADGADPVYYLVGACCYNGDCYENQSEDLCPDAAGATWLGPGTTCQDLAGGCTPSPVVDPDSNWSIVNTYFQMASEWNLAEALPNHQFHDIRVGSNFIVLLSGFPYERPYFSDVASYPAGFGVEPQGSAAGEQRTLCVQGDSPYAVAAVRGTFPWPGIPFDRDDANWDLVATIRALGLGIGVNETSSYGYDRCFGPPCEGVPATEDCIHEYFNSGQYTAGGPPINTDNMPSTLMSYCASCPGGSANVQLRFRSEIAARLYSRFANMDCSWSEAGGLDPNAPTVPYAADDFYILQDGVPQYLDVMSNDVAPGCVEQYDNPAALYPLELSQLGIFDPAAPGAPNFVPDGSAQLPGNTVLGGTVDIVPDPANPGGDLVVIYTPPADSCGVDVFEYEIITDPPAGDPPVDPQTDTARVRIVQRACTNSVTVCPPCYESITEPTLPPTPPQPPYGSDVIVLTDSPGASFDSFSWLDLELTVTDASSTSPEEAFFRIWLTDAIGNPTDPNAVPPPFIDVHPFGTPAECGPTPAFTWNGASVVTSSGTCLAPPNLYVPPSGEILIQCLEESDDLPGADATWTGGEVCIVTEQTNAFGACCLDGLCYETTAYDCGALGWSYQWWQDPNTGRWEYRMVSDPYASGFFMGAGTTCTERDWCRRTAPCCYTRPNGQTGCALLTCEECRDIGGELRDIWANWQANGTDHCTVPGGQRSPGGDMVPPLWDTPCEYPVCFTDPEFTVGACCVEQGGLRFCSDLTREDCELFGGPTASWSLRGRCDEVPCTPLGACCVLDASGTVQSCTDNLDAQACQLTWGTVNPDDSVVFHPGDTCSTAACDLSATGACCLPDQGVCCDSFTREVCDLVYGTFLGQGSDCTTCTSSSSPTGACSIVTPGGISVCSTDLTSTGCQSLGGTWYAGLDTCSEGIPGIGVGLGGSVGACCYEFECVGSVAELDCILAGGIPIAKADNPWHPDCTPPTPGPLWGGCCYDNPRYGTVCIDQPSQAACESLNNGQWCGTSRCEFLDPTCTQCQPLDLCAPGTCRIELGNFGGPSAPYELDTIAADEQRCLDRGGVWLGQVTAPAHRATIAGDLDGDGRVGTSDLLRLLAAWGTVAGEADLDGSGRVDVGDLQYMLMQWR